MSAHDLLIAPFAYEFMRRGLLSAMLLGVSGELLGCRPRVACAGWRWMGDALSHSLLPGIAVAWLLFGTNTAALFLGGLLAGLLTALGSALLSRLTRVKEDAAFGSLFIVFFGVGVALISKLPTRLNLADFLFGNVLGVSGPGLGLAAPRSAAPRWRRSSSSSAASCSRPSTRSTTARPAGAAAWSIWASSR